AATEAELLARAARLTIVVEVRRCRAVSALWNFDPSIRVEHQILVRIDTPAIRILQVERLPGHTILARGSHERVIVEDRVRGGDRDQRATLVDHQAAQRPAANYLPD